MTKWKRCRLCVDLRWNEKYREMGYFTLKREARVEMSKIVKKKVEAVTRENKKHG